MEISAAGHIAADASHRRIKAERYAVILLKLKKMLGSVELFGIIIAEIEAGPWQTGRTAA